MFSIGEMRLVLKCPFYHWLSYRYGIQDSLQIVKTLISPQGNSFIPFIYDLIRLLF